VKQPLATIASIAGTMEELNLNIRKAQQERIDFYNQLVYYGKMKGYKDGCAAVQFKAKHGVYPNGYKPNPIPPDAKTVSWIKSRTIAWAKSKEKYAEKRA